MGVSYGVVSTYIAMHLCSKLIVACLLECIDGVNNMK